MSTVQIEIKGADIDHGGVTSLGFPPKSNHIQANVSMETTDTWSIVSDLNEIPAGTENLIISNLGTDTVAMAFSNQTIPDRFHVIIGGTQRELIPLAGAASLPARIKHL